MKNKLRLIGIILLVMIIALSAAACAKNPFVGTWNTDVYGLTISLVFTDKTFTLTSFGVTESGTYTRSGNTATMSANGETSTAVINGNTLNLDGMVFTKQ